MIAPTRRWPTPAQAAVACGAALLLLAAVGRLTQGPNPEHLQIGPLVFTAVAFVAAAVKVLTVTPGRLPGSLLLAAGLTAAVYAVAASWANAASFLWWFHEWAWCLPEGLAICALLTTPGDRELSRRARVAVVLAGGTVGVAAALLAIDAWFNRSVPIPERLVSNVFIAGMVMVLLAYVVLVAFAMTLAARWRHAASEARECLAWSLAATTAYVVKLVLEQFDSAEADWLPAVAAGCVAMAALTVADPYRIVTALGETLERRLSPQTVLPALTECLARSLRVPYVAIELVGPGSREITAEYGTAPDTVETFDMVTRGEYQGSLLVSPPAGARRFTARECQLLRTLARQAAITAETARLDRDLQASRQRLVTAREEERRRLRRDLHDGLGPSLVGMAMQVRAARRHLPATDPAAGILDSLDTDLRTCTSDVRHLVERLRPAALDCGLLPALRGECRRFDSSACPVELLVDGPVEALPAAAEVAAYRVVSEALTNVAKHADAQRCCVHVHYADGALTIDITDDGVGLPDPVHAGVGLCSMRERAAELGGTCTISTASPRGTVMRLWIPVSEARIPERGAS
ncbi:sensor histidine kinase [Actinoplanes xinjiangensis]|uniref:sensor histidine kinase n=1 Tax=Actinoplanes xinjiangensis TaxID=512350 RepID=UPI00343B75C9